jgi:hypothetical protein
VGVGVSEDVTSLNELVDKLTSLACREGDINATSKIEILILEVGYVLRWTEEAGVFKQRYGATCEAIERESQLMKRLGEIIGEKRGVK